MISLSLFFFFQAEDGIRDLVRSRGLGDVYKRQDVFALHSIQGRCVLAASQRATGASEVVAHRAVDSVSYTHLTLPTSDLV